MKILVPITNSSDIDVFNPNIYNTEFFFGYLPQWWIDEYNTPKDKSLNCLHRLITGMEEVLM